MDPAMFRLFGLLLLALGIVIAIPPPRLLVLLEVATDLFMTLDDGIYHTFHADRDTVAQRDQHEARALGFSIAVVGLGFVVGAWLDHGGVILLIGGLGLLRLDTFAARVTGLASLSAGFGFSIGIAFESAGSIPLAIVLGFVGIVTGLVYWIHQQATV